MSSKKTLVMGASDNPNRYSYLAVNKLRAFGHPVEAIGRKAVTVGDVQVNTTPLPLQDIDTVTMYLSPENQRPYYDYILGLHPKRIIFNPGAENEDLAAKARAMGIHPQEACTLVLLSTGQY